MRRATAPSAIGCKGLSVRSLTARYEWDMACSDADIQGGEIRRDKGRKRRFPPITSFAHKYPMDNCHTGELLTNISGSGVQPTSVGRRRSARAVPYAMNDDFVICYFVEDQVWIRASNKTAQPLALGAGADVGVVERELDDL